MHFYLQPNEAESFRINHSQGLYMDVKKEEIIQAHIEMYEYSELIFQ